MAEQQDLDQKNCNKFADDVKSSDFCKTSWLCALLFLPPHCFLQLCPLDSVQWVVMCVTPERSGAVPFPMVQHRWGHGSTLRHPVTSSAEKAGWQEEEPNHRLNRLGGAFHGLQSDLANPGNLQPLLWHLTQPASSRFPCSHLCLSKHGTDLFLSQA